MCSRNRMPRITPEEKDLLLSLVQKFSDIVENKKVTSQALKEKSDQWEAIANIFNANSSVCYRSGPNLRSCWDNLKKFSKRRANEEKSTVQDSPKRRKEIPRLEKIFPIPQPVFDSQYMESVRKVANMQYPSPKSPPALNNTLATKDTKVGQLFPTHNIVCMEEFPNRLKHIPLSPSTTLAADADIEDIVQLPNTSFEQISFQKRTADQHNLQMKIASVQLAIAEEKLKQEMIKTELLDLELREKKL